MSNRREGEHRITEQYREPLPYGSRGGIGIGQAAPWVAIIFIVLFISAILGGWMLIHWIMTDAWKTHPFSVLVLYGLLAAAAIFWIFVFPIIKAVINLILYKKREEAKIGALVTNTSVTRINAERHGFNAEYVEGSLALRSINPKSIAPAGNTTINNLGGDGAPEEGEEDDSIDQPTVEEIIPLIKYNSYETIVGRSLYTGEYLQMGLEAKHLKVIGASQKGKSSFAASLMKIITGTHDPEHIQLALLDLENKTSKLFVDLPHVASHTVGGRQVPLIARCEEEVLTHLGYLEEIKKYRYTLSQKQIDNLPIILVYLEEVLSLKDHFKTLAQGGAKGGKENYALLMRHIKELARRGLKVRMQLLACTQSDYRDKDLVEAWVNISNGLSFSVPPKAAQAAGFNNFDQLTQNYTDNEPAQFVVQTPELRDLGIAPYFNLKQELRDFEEEQERATEGFRLGSPVATTGTPATEPFYNNPWQSREETTTLLNGHGNSVVENVSAMPVGVLEWPVEPLPNIAEPLPDIKSEDYLLSDLQIELFIVYYRDCGNIMESLSRIRNDKGQGLGRRYFKHASRIVKEKGLKKGDR